MRRGFFILLLLFLLFVNFVEGSDVDLITGESITGDATRSVGLNISVTAYSPTLTIFSPQNATYLFNESLLLSYFVGGEDAVWYNLDDLSNITITSNVYFNVSQGAHTLYLYANGSFGNITSKSVSFFVDSGLFVIIDDEYETSEDLGEDVFEMRRNEKKGESTDFFDYSYEELQNLDGVILHQPIYGKISFNEAINLTDDENSSDGILDLNVNTDISSNRIEINPIALPNFDKAATLWIYGLSFSNPRILKNGVVCSSSECVAESYSGGTLKFNVSSSSIYTVEETPVVEIPNIPSPPSSSSGIVGGVLFRDFDLNEEKIKVSFKQGETKQQKIVIVNTGNRDFWVEVENNELADFIRVVNADFYLKRGEVREIILDFIAREDAFPDLYIGKIIVRTEGVEKELLIAIEIESKAPLFDVKAKIPSQFLYVVPSDEFAAEVSLYNMGGTERVDVDVVCVIMDEDGNVVISEQETMAVETQASFVKNFRLPGNIKPGNYMFYVKVTYEGEVASSSAWFFVVLSEEEFPLMGDILWTLAVVFVIILLLILWFVLHRIRESDKPKKSKKTEKSKKPKK